MAETNLDTVGKRLKYYIEKVLGETISQYTSNIGLSGRSNTISNYTKDKYEISGEMLRRMRTYKKNFPVLWILEGKGEIPEMEVETEQDKKDVIISELKDRITFLENLVMKLMEKNDKRMKRNGTI